MVGGVRVGWCCLLGRPSHPRHPPFRFDALSRIRADEYSSVMKRLDDPAVNPQDFTATTSTSTAKAGCARGRQVYRKTSHGRHSFACMCACVHRPPALTQDRASLEAELAALNAEQRMAVEVYREQNGDLTESLHVAEALLQSRREKEASFASRLTKRETALSHRSIVRNQSLLRFEPFVGVFS